MQPVTEMIVTIATAIVGLAIISVLVSRRSQTPAVIQAGGAAFGNSLAVAESPVTGAQYHVDLSYPGESMVYAYAGGL